MNLEQSRAEDPLKLIGAVLPSTPTHPQVRVVVGSRSADIDVEIAPLIEKMWELHIDTDMSCQDWAGRPGYVWLSFHSQDDLHRFLLRVATDVDERFRGRMLDRQGEKPWEYRIIPYNTCYYNSHRRPGAVYAIPPGYDWGPQMITSSIQLSFPQEDLPKVRQAFGVQTAQVAL